MFNIRKLADFPVGADVIVHAWGIGARLSDVTRTGTVVALGRTRVKVNLTAGNGYPAETRTFDPGEIRPIPSRRTR